MDKCSFAEMYEHVLMCCILSTCRLLGIANLQLIYLFFIIVISHDQSPIREQLKSSFTDKLKISIV